jgi:flavorubredoxin
MEQFFGASVAPKRLVVKEGDVLDLGKHKLTFVAAPMVHWPEVMVSYDSTDKVLFSADGFGKFGANDVEDPEGWDCEARRYYIGIVGKYGAQTQALLKKAAALDIQTVCPLHGPILKGEAISHAIEKYLVWSSYSVESEGVCIAYATIYGNTRRGAEILAEELEALGVKVSIMDLARCDIHEAVEDAFRYDRLVLAASTYNGGVFTPMREFIAHLTERNYQNRKVAFIENGSWAPMATKTMKAMLEGSKNLSFAETEVKITSSVNDTTIASIKALAKELSEM